MKKLFRFILNLFKKHKVDSSALEIPQAPLPEELAAPSEVEVDEAENLRQALVFARNRFFTE